MRRSLRSITVVTVLLVSLIGVTAVPMTAQSVSISTVVSNGEPGEVVNETSMDLSANNTINITVKAENASAPVVTIDRSMTTNTVNVTVDANG